MSPRAHNPAARYSSCERCDRRGYYTRDDARKVRKRHHGEKGITVYACPHTAGMFHVGHRPEALSHGKIDRDVLRTQAVRVAAEGERLP